MSETPSVMCAVMAGTDGTPTSQELHTCLLIHRFVKSLGHRGQTWAGISLVAAELCDSVGVFGPLGKTEVNPKVLSHRYVYCWSWEGNEGRASAPSQCETS